MTVKFVIGGTLSTKYGVCVVEKGSREVRNNEVQKNKVVK